LLLLLIQDVILCPQRAEHVADYDALDEQSDFPPVEISTAWSSRRAVIVFIENADHRDTTLN
jgi:hypothetical protein